MCKVRSGVLLLVCLFYVTSFCDAFDGNRKGLVLGGGVGFSPKAEWNWNDMFAGENKSGVGWEFLFGYAWNNKNILVAEYNGALFSSDFYNQDVILLYAGPVWYHYFKEGSKGWYTAIGLWRYGISLVEDNKLANGWGGIVGGGYEFTKQVQVGIYYGAGKIKYCGSDDDRSWCQHINLIITVVAY